MYNVNKVDLDHTMTKSKEVKTPDLARPSEHWQMQKNFKKTWCRLLIWGRSCTTRKSFLFPATALFAQGNPEYSSRVPRRERRSNRKCGECVATELKKYFSFHLSIDGSRRMVDLTIGI